MSSDRLYINKKKPNIIIPIQHFEADFLWEASLKILNSEVILKTFTHVHNNL